MKIKLNIAKNVIYVLKNMIIIVIGLENALLKEIYYFFMDLLFLLCFIFYGIF